jgi:hypothetical protein
MKLLLSLLALILTGFIFLLPLERLALSFQTPLLLSILSLVAADLGRQLMRQAIVRLAAVAALVGLELALTFR